MTRRTRTALIGGVLVARAAPHGRRLPDQEGAHRSSGRPSVCTAVTDWVERDQDRCDGPRRDADRHEPRTCATSATRSSATSATPQTRPTHARIDGLKEAGIPKTPKGTKATRARSQDSFKKIRTSAAQAPEPGRGHLDQAPDEGAEADHGAQPPGRQGVHLVPGAARPS